MISTEKVFDMLPVVTTLYDKLDLDGYRKKFAKENKGKENTDGRSIGIDVFKYILTNSQKVKEEIFEIVAVFEEQTIEEVKAQGFMKTLNSLKEIFSDKETVDFLKQAIV